MKKIVLLIICLLLVGCNYNEEEHKDNKVPVRLKEIESKPVEVTLNEDGNIVIDQSTITNKATYFTYEYEGVTIGLLSVRNSEGKVIVVINTCQSCGGSPYAYFVQVGNKIQCQNCGYLFDIDELDNLTPDGCNPIKIEDIKDKDGKIIIGVKQLHNLKDKFKNWKGPKLDNK